MIPSLKNQAFSKILLTSLINVRSIECNYEFSTFSYTLLFFYIYIFNISSFSLPSIHYCNFHLFQHSEIVNIPKTNGKYPYKLYFNCKYGRTFTYIFQIIQVNKNILNCKYK